MTPLYRALVCASACVLVSTTVVAARQQNPFLRASAPQWACEEDMHDFYVRRFEAADGLGASRMPQPIMLDRSGVLVLGGTRYSIERLELVGLLKSPVPVTYLQLRHRMPLGLSLDPSRSLTAFEQKALTSLRAGRIIERTMGGEPGTVVVMGALRGGGMCLKCHTEAREGDLLGAFSYQLREIGATNR